MKSSKLSIWSVLRVIPMFFAAAWAAAIAGAYVLESLKPLATSPVSAVLVLGCMLLSLVTTVVIVFMALYRLDGLATRIADSLEGKKYSIQILNIPRACSIWLIDKSTEGGIYNCELDGHGVIGIGFFRIKPGESLSQIYRHQHYTAYRFWRFSVELGKR